MTIMALLGNIWFRRGVLAVVIIAGAFGLRQHYVNVGKDQGKQEAAQQTKQQVQQEVSDATKEFRSTLSVLNTQMAGYQKQLEASDATTKAALALVSEISKDRAAGSAKVGALPDSEVHGFVVSTLGLRKPGETATCYTPAEEREIAFRVEDDPKCNQENIQNGKAAAASESSRKTLQAENSTWAAKYDNLAQLETKVMASYVQIYNAFPRKTNRLLWLITLGHRGKEKRLPFPDPKELSGNNK